MEVYGYYAHARSPLDGTFNNYHVCKMVGEAGMAKLTMHKGHTIPRY